MTEKEAENILIRFCDSKVKNSGYWFFNRRKFYFNKTRLLKPYEREANLSLPKSLQVGNALFDNKGVTLNSKLYEWQSIISTGIICGNIDYYDVKIADYNNKPDDYFVFCLENGDIIEAHLGDTRHLYNQLGHFLEQYKSGDKQL